VSTEEQADEGASLEAQRGILTAEALRRGWDLEVVADEGVSAKAVDTRPALVSALERLDRGDADLLVSVRLDRLSRSVRDFVGLLDRSKRQGWALVCLDLNVDTSSPAGDLMANVMASVAQYERLVIGQRTREGMAQKRREGVHTGRPSTLPTEIRTRIRTARTAGETLAKIAQGLNEDAIPTARGGQCWHPSTVKAVLASVDLYAEHAAVLQDDESWHPVADRP
jgi:DNA invertase Pin-like site-specific DNA recombinase